MVVGKPPDRPLFLPLHAVVAKVEEGACSFFGSLLPHSNIRGVDPSFQTRPAASDSAAVRIISLDPCYIQRLQIKADIPFLPKGSPMWLEYILVYNP